MIIQNYHRRSGMCTAVMCFLINGISAAALATFSPMAILIAGIGIFAVILGVYGMQKAPSAKGRTGIGLSIIVVLGSCAAGIAILGKAPTAQTREEMFRAAAKGNTAKVKELVAKDTGIKGEQENIATMLHNAIQAGNYPMVCSLVEGGADVHIKTRDGTSMLHLAAAQNSSDIIALLVDAGIEVNITDSHGRTPLQLAAERGQMDNVKYLLAHGAKPDYGKTDSRFPNALQTAVKNKNIELVKLFIEHGANVHVKTRDGFSMLHLAVAGKNNNEIISLLLDAGVEVDAPDSQGNTPLFWAVERALMPNIELLMAHGANMYKEDKPGHAPFYRGVRYLPYEDFLVILNKYAAPAWKEDTIMIVDAAGNRDPNVYLYLMQNGIPINVRDKYGTTTLHSFAGTGHKELALMALNAGANINDHGKSGNTPLHSAIHNGHMDMVKLLVERGADINARGYGSQTPLEYAMSMSRFSFRKDNGIIDYLMQQKMKQGGTDVLNDILETAIKQGDKDLIQDTLSRGADINKMNSQGVTPLHLACNGRDRYEIVQMLIDKGADVNARDKSQQTPLHLAAAQLRARVAELLIEHGAEINARDQDGQTPLDKAYNDNAYSRSKKSAQEESVSLLKSHGAVDTGTNTLHNKSSTTTPPDAKN